MRDSVFKWRIVENVKIFRNYVKHFSNLRRVRNTEFSFVNATNFSLIFHSHFLTDTHYKIKLAPASF